MGSLCSQISTSNRSNGRTAANLTRDSSSSVFDRDDRPVNSLDRSDTVLDRNQSNIVPSSDQTCSLQNKTSSLPDTTTIDHRSSTPVQFQYTSNHSVTMPVNQTHRCEQCGMFFSSYEAQLKHKTRFCLGVQDSGIGREHVVIDQPFHDRTHSTRHMLDHTQLVPVRSSVDKVGVSLSNEHYSCTCNYMSMCTNDLFKKRNEIIEPSQQRAMLDTLNSIDNRIFLDKLVEQDRSGTNAEQERIYNDILLDVSEYDWITLFMIEYHKSMRKCDISILILSFVRAKTINGDHFRVHRLSTSFLLSLSLFLHFFVNIRFISIKTTSFLTSANEYKHRNVPSYVICTRYTQIRCP
jgi:hypothetical protein